MSISHRTPTTLRLGALTAGRYRAALVSLLTLAGCSTGGGVDSTTTTIGATTTATTQPTTTTTLDDEGVLSAFLVNITLSDFKSMADLSIEIHFGDTVVEAAGTMELDGGNQHTVLDLAGLQRRETISYAGTIYERVEDGPWVSDESVTDPFADPGAGADPGQDLELAALLKTIGDLEHQATVVEDGVTLHRLGLPEGVPIDPVAFGFGPDDPVTIEATFWAKGDGRPHEFEFVIEDLSDPELTQRTVMTLRFVESDDPIEVVAPRESWLKYTSTDSGYVIGHPRSWEVEEFREDLTADFFVGLSGEELDLYRNDLDPPGRVALNAWVEALRSSLSSQGVSFREPTEIVVSALPGRMIVYTGSDEFGDFLVIYAVTQVSEGVVFEFLFFGDPDDEEGTQKLMDDLLTTFQFVG